MPKYAKDTDVSVEKSRVEVESTLRRYGADGFRYGWSDRGGRRVEQLEFSAYERLIRFTVEMPSKDDFARTPHRGHLRSADQRIKLWEQACRQRWRALCLCIKAKLEAVECGMAQFEKEFLAQIVDPETNRTIGDIMAPQIKSRYAGTGGPLGLPGLPAPENGPVDHADSQ